MCYHVKNLFCQIDPIVLAFWIRWTLDLCFGLGNTRLDLHLQSKTHKQPKIGLFCIETVHLSPIQSKGLEPIISKMPIVSPVHTLILPLVY